MLFRAFDALPRSIKGPDGKPVQRPARHANLSCASGEDEPRAVVLDSARRRGDIASSYFRHTTRPGGGLPDEPAAGRTPTILGASAGPWPRPRKIEADESEFLSRRGGGPEGDGGRWMMTATATCSNARAVDAGPLREAPASRAGSRWEPAEVKERDGIPPKLSPIDRTEGRPVRRDPRAKGRREDRGGAAAKARLLEKVLDHAIP